MKHFSIFLIFTFVSIFFVFLPLVTISSADNSVTTGPVQVSASVGEYYLNLSGYIAPYASVVLISDDIALRSTVADANGYFYITGVLINKGFSNFCLDAIDYKRLGESYTCFTIPPATNSVTQNNIFLPPTLGLQRTQINAGDNAVIWGYSMPGAIVTVHSSDGKTYTVTANGEGYYEIHVNIAAAGKYELFADANYQNKQSLTPDRKTLLIALSVAQQVGNFWKSFLLNLLHFIIGNPWGILLIVLPILILIIILLKKLFPRLFTFIDRGEDVLIAHLPFIHRKLHHWWFIGY